MLRELFNKYMSVSFPRTCLAQAYASLTNRCLSPHLYLLFRTVSQFLPRPRSLLLGDTIQFEDVLGTVRILPFAYFQHFDVSKPFLLNHPIRLLKLGDMFPTCTIGLITCVRTYPGV